MKPVTSVLDEWIRNSMHYSMEHIFTFAKDNNLSMSHLGALMRIYHGETAGICHLGEGLGISSAAASQLLDKLFQRGLIVRNEDKQDRRVKKINLTPQGLAIVNACLTAKTTTLERLVESLTPEEQEQTNEVLERLISKIRLISTINPEKGLSFDVKH